MSNNDKEQIRQMNEDLQDDDFWTKEDIRARQEAAENNDTYHSQSLRELEGGRHGATDNFYATNQEAYPWNSSQGTSQRPTDPYNNFARSYDSSSAAQVSEKYSSTTSNDSYRDDQGQLPTNVEPGTFQDPSLAQQWASYPSYPLPWHPNAQQQQGVSYVLSGASSATPNSSPPTSSTFYQYPQVMEGTEHVNAATWQQGPNGQMLMGHPPPSVWGDHQAHYFAQAYMMGQQAAQASQAAMMFPPVYSFPYQPLSPEMLPKRQTAQGGAASVSKKKPRKKKEGPTRPLSAYNVFFKRERERLLGERGVAVEQLEPAKKKKKGSRRKRHGVIAFDEMARMIASKWKDCPEEEKAFCEQVAKADSERYQLERKEYIEKKDAAESKPQESDSSPQETDSSPEESS